jgi:hypothetical protein
MLGGYPLWTVKALAVSGGRRFEARHDCIMVVKPVELADRLADFEALRCPQFELILTEGGWIRFVRESCGRIEVSYRISAAKIPAAFDGSVRVEGEFSSELIRGVRRILL